MLSDDPAVEPEGFGVVQAGDLIVEPTQEEIRVEWGFPAEVPLMVSWAKGQKYAVQVEAAAGTPAWLQVETRPVILDPPGEMLLVVTVEPGSGRLGKHTLVLEASAFSLKKPQIFEIEVEIVRESGEFQPVYAAQVAVECRNICAKVRRGRVAFFDLLKEMGQSCNNPASIPEDQKIGFREFGMSNKGFGYGRTCKVACVYESSGGFSVVNLGFYDHSVPRGESLLQLRHVSDCWLSADNTIALVRDGSALTPYDILTGQPLAEMCRITGDFQGARLDGNRLTAFGSRDCEWLVK
jgi:hypothetical protein